MAQRLAPVRPVSPVGAARTVRAVGTDLFDLAQRAKARWPVFIVGPTATPIRFCRIGNRREPRFFIVGRTSYADSFLSDRQPT